MPFQPHLSAVRIMALSLVCGCLSLRAAPAPGAAADVRQERLQTAVARVFDPSVLHRIDIVIAPEDVSRILNRTSDRVRCTFSIDGIVFKNVGVRQAGGTFNRFVGIEEKPTLSVKFDDFVDGQELHGLEKIILKDGRQDTGLVGEHLTYEVYRRAGIAAPMTAHAHVTINGNDSGIYVMREPINRDFLTRNFGREFSNGNVYELTYRPDPMLRLATSRSKTKSSSGDSGPSCSARRTRCRTRRRRRLHWPCPRTSTWIATSPTTPSKRPPAITTASRSTSTMPICMRIRRMAA